MLDDPTDFPEAEYGTTAMRRWCLANRVIFAANAPNTRLSYQPPRYKRHVIQVVDPIALQNNRNWLAVLVRVLKNDNISAQDLAQNWKTVPTHLDRVSNQSSDVLVAAIITHPGNQLVQPFSVQHPQNDGPTFYYKVGLEGTSEEVRQRTRTRYKRTWFDVSCRSRLATTGSRLCGLAADRDPARYGS